MNRSNLQQDLATEARSFPLLAQVGEDALEELCALALCHDYPKNNILFYQGDPAGTVFMVVSGQVKITLMNEEGKEVVLSLVEPGGLFGLVPILDSSAQVGNAITVVPSRLARFDGEALLDWLNRQPAMQARLLGLMAGRVRVRQAYQKIGEHALLGVKERLLYALLEIAEREGETEQGGDVVVFTRPTHQELANWVGSSREVVSRLLKELLDSELLQAEGRILRVPESALVLREE